jgi:hypothetical protein
MICEDGFVDKRKDSAIEKDLLAASETLSAPATAHTTALITTTSKAETPQPGLIVDNRLGGRMVRPKSPPLRYPLALAPQCTSPSAPPLVAAVAGPVKLRAASYASVVAGPVPAPVLKVVGEVDKEEGWVCVRKKTRRK